MNQERSLTDLLDQHRGSLLDFVRRQAAPLLGFEADVDLVQGVVCRALASADRFEDRTDAEFFGWIHTIARRHIADRADYWAAKKRGAARVLRLTWSGESAVDPDAARAPATASRGPFTVAMRRELLQLALESLAVLPERDRKLVRWASEGVSLDEQATRLGVSYDAVQRAGHRAMERFRRTFELAQRRRTVE